MRIKFADHVLTEFNKRLLEIKYGDGLTQKEIVVTHKVALSNIRKYLTGHSSLPTTKTMKKISELMGRPLVMDQDFFLVEDPAEEPKQTFKTVIDKFFN